MPASGILIAIAITLGEIVAKAIDALVESPVQFLVLVRRAAATGAKDKYASDQNDRNQRVEPPSHASISNGRSQGRAEKIIVHGAPISAQRPARKRG
ncbi:hypothetical protein JQ616_04565 [Bradyrhizobium tropiciagri]|uniref:hypothetical protein n=1 Tax=Bradyrhizobium tropiciagri TaxID=312253 RepID=UPI001BAA655E|nr:hypothetical protein [Bradyrhizobium tropiciagri]MBR0894214.1 hypothetical protein [Bradyrhizobium tropiciagri]